MIPKMAAASSLTAPRTTQVGSLGTVTFGRDMDGNFICPLPGCSKLFGKYNSAQKHFTSNHSGIEFNCKMCEQKFNRRESLKRHAVNVHKLNGEMAAAMLK